MVRGLEKFKEYFAEYEANYVIIGGAACDLYEENFAQIPRATKDIDVILVVEALSAAFVAKFWDFVIAAGYKGKNIGRGEDLSHKHEYYRFNTPADAGFPYQIELFSRQLGLINFPEDARIIPIPVDEDLSSLSAILMNDDYYNFTINHSKMEHGVHIANIESLICLKCKAFLEMVERKNSGDSVDSKHISKHKKDVFRLAAMLAPADRFVVPKSLFDDIHEFCDLVRNDLPDANFFNSAGLKGVDPNSLVEILIKCFGL
mgnify:FL=1